MFGLTKSSLAKPPLLTRRRTVYLFTFHGYWRMALNLSLIYSCKDCGVDINLHPNFEVEEIISCPECGLDYIVRLDEYGRKTLVELAIEGEDWGE